VGSRVMQPKAGTPVFPWLFRGAPPDQQLAPDQPLAWCWIWGKYSALKSEDAIRSTIPGGAIIIKVWHALPLKSKRQFNNHLVNVELCELTMWTVNENQNPAPGPVLQTNNFWFWFWKSDPVNQTLCRSGSY